MHLYISSSHFADVIVVWIDSIALFLLDIKEFILYFNF